ncbi:MAG: molybdopterin dehydrogenase FAD-binding protein, partial [Nocardioidaceae bacterium]|nr:molybdopterin dehydrogenase FAD-binding protein [Nocardioidaceae bacterium]
MKPPAFAYRDPRSLEDALSVLAEDGDDVSILSGGQSLMPLLNMRLARPAVLLDINRVPGLDRLQAVEDGGTAVVRAGALVRASGLERDADVARLLPVVRTALQHVGHPQIRA